MPPLNPSQDRANQVITYEWVRGGDNSPQGCFLCGFNLQLKDSTQAAKFSNITVLFCSAPMFVLTLWQIIVAVVASDLSQSFNFSFASVCHVPGEGHNVRLPGGSSGELCKDGPALPFD